jgi:hypothetical protein
VASAPGKVVATTLGWLVWPWPLTSSASLHMGPPPLWRWATACAAAVGLVALWRAAPRRNGLLLSCAGLAWLPTVFAVAMTYYVGERFLYLPIAFCAIAVAATLPARRATRFAGVGAALAALAALTIRVPDWRSEEDLWRAATVRAPDPLSYAQLATTLELQGKPREAFHAWMGSTEQEPLLRASCFPPVRLLVLTGAATAAADLSERLVDRGCAEEDFNGWRGVALLSAGRADRARDAMAGGPWRTEDVPIVAAVCALDGDLDCVAGWAMGWSGGPSALLMSVFDLVSVRERPPARGDPVPAG